MANNFKTARQNNAKKTNIHEKPRQQEKKQEKTFDYTERLIDWITFYRRNLHRAVQHYLQLDLHLYQAIALYLMNICPLVVIVACRASAKSYIIAIFACIKAILYPNSLIVIASATKKQASLIVTEKIVKELMPKSPNLRREIKQIKTSGNETEVMFVNGSSIVVVPATDNARGYRATCLVYEEFRMIKKDIIDFVLSPFLIIRQVPYLNNPEYEHLKEEPTEIYISSAYFAQHWMSKMIKLSVTDMYKKSEALFLAFDYSITLKHNIRTRKQLIKEKKKLGTVAYAMEYENTMVGQGEDAFYSFDLMNNAQSMKKAFYPRTTQDVLEKKKNPHDIPKQNGEKRLISVDIAMVNNDKNDNTVITCIRALPSGDIYERQIPYIEAFKGDNTTVQATRIKEIFYDFDADILVLDTQNAGLSIADELGKITYSEERDKEYPPFKCFNDEDVAKRIKNKDALPVLFSYKGQSKINEQMHYAMKDALDRKKLKLLINAVQARDYLDTKPFYNKKDIGLEQQVLYELVYVQTDLLINEMVGLNQTISKGCLALEEPTASATKDRYISLAMGNYLIKQWELDLQEKDSEESWSDAPSFVTSYTF
jgi:hypothetical protein